jgi:hypothetical protein
VALQPQQGEHPGGGDRSRCIQYGSRIYSQSGLASVYWDPLCRSIFDDPGGQNVEEAALGKLGRVFINFDE